LKIQALKEAVSQAEN